MFRPHDKQIWNNETQLVLIFVKRKMLLSVYPELKLHNQNTGGIYHNTYTQVLFTTFHASKSATTNDPACTLAILVVKYRNTARSK